MPGLVVPLWLAHYEPRADHDLQSSVSWEARSVVLDAVVARHPELFARHGVLLWLYRTFNSVDARPDVGDAGTSTVAWRQWWMFTKKFLSWQYPAGARLYERLVKRG
jgi:hypothetical protein